MKRIIPTSPTNTTLDKELVYRLANLDLEDLPTYVLSNGRSGGQTIYGGVSAGETLTLAGTSKRLATNQGAVVVASTFRLQSVGTSPTGGVGFLVLESNDNVALYTPGLAWATYAPDSLTKTIGGAETGTVTDMATAFGPAPLATYTVAEAGGGAPGIDLQVDWASGVTTFSQINMRVRYGGTANIQVQLYDWTNALNQTIWELTQSSYYSYITCDGIDPTDFVSGGAVRMRFYGTGSVTGSLYVDYLSLRYLEFA